MTTIFVNVSDITRLVVLFIGIVDLNFDDFLVLQVKGTVEFMSIPAAALKFKRLTVVKHPVELFQVFIVLVIQGAQKLRQGATSILVCADGLFARKSNCFEIFVQGWVDSVSLAADSIDSEIISYPGAENLVDLFHAYEIYRANKREHFHVAL